MSFPTWEEHNVFLINSGEKSNRTVSCSSSLCCSGWLTPSPGFAWSAVYSTRLLNTKVKEKNPKIWLNSCANLLEGWPVCYSYLITLKLLWLQLRARVQGHTLKSCGFSSTFSFPLLVLWLWEGGPRGLVEGAGGWRCSRSCPRSSQCPAPCVSIGGGEGTSCTYLVSASWEQARNMSDNVFHIEIIKENCCWREMCL